MRRVGPASALRAGAALTLAALVAGLGLAIGAPEAARAQVRSPASISLDPACGPAGGSGTYSLKVTGDNFNPYSSLLVSFDSGTGGHPESFQATTDGFGHFETTIEPGPRGAGTYQVRADDFKLRETTATFSVPCPSRPGGAGNPNSAPHLQFDPDIGPPGIVTQVTGQGFPPGAKVAVTWDAIPGYPFTTPVTADSSGAITVAPEGFVIFSGTPLGTYTLKATPGPGAPGFSEADAQFTVVPGSVQPSNFKVRR
jgi:hypothetical protein